MTSRHRAIVAAGLGSLLVLAGCDRSARHDRSPAETQPGAANEPREKPGEQRNVTCDDLPSADALERLLKDVPNDAEAGGLFSGRKEWAAIVNRSGELCAVVVSTADASEAWPGSQAIAKAKAYTANAFSTDEKPMSTARLYTMTQPGHWLWGLAAGNPMNPACLETPAKNGTPAQRLCGGTIAFGGGVPLYKGKTRVGGLGASGDTACADHEIAKRIRDKAGLNPAGGAFADDITYAAVDGASAFTHPLCPNTWRNGQKIGDEAVATGY